MCVASARRDLNPLVRSDGGPRPAERGVACYHLTYTSIKAIGTADAVGGMSEKTAERTRETDSDDDAPVVGQTDAESESESAGTVFSVRAQIVAFVAIGVGMILGSLVPLIPFTALAGIPVGAFLHGLLDSQRRYVETAVAGSVSAGVAVVSSLLPQLLAGLNGTRLFAIAAGIGLVLAIIGHNIGRDLRDGLTRDLQ